MKVRNSQADGTDQRSIVEIVSKVPVLFVSQALNNFAKDWRGSGHQGKGRLEVHDAIGRRQTVYQLLDVAVEDLQVLMLLATERVLGKVSKDVHLERKRRLQVRERDLRRVENKVLFCSAAVDQSPPRF